jgi:hypothetical protein
LSDEEEIPLHIQAWQEESWTAHTGTNHAEILPIHTDYCTFYEGNHYPGYRCPHDEYGIDQGSRPYAEYATTVEF